jgi:hypothetical protein
MNASYQVVTRQDSQEVSEFLAKEGQFLLPMLELISQGQAAVDEVIDVMGRATLEAILKLSAQEVGGPKHPGKAGGEIRWHGRQQGVVCLAERKLRVDKPRLRRKPRQGAQAIPEGQAESGAGEEVEIPVYAALRNDSRLGRRMLAILLNGVSTRKYRKVLPEMAESVGISRSSVSRESIEASVAALQALAQRDFTGQDILILYLDGLIFGKQHVLAAVGVDVEGYKHVLGVVAGASENATAAKALLEDLVARGVKPGRRRLFVIDGSKALRSAIEAVYGQDNPVQRCRSHKLRNVLDNVPKELKEQVKAALRAAYRLEAGAGMARLERQAEWLEKE